MLSAVALDLTGGRHDRSSSDTVAPFFASRRGARQRTELSASERGLDWFTFSIADIQTGFGPFVAVYLTAHAWAQFDIGLVLTAGGLVALSGQMPGGALVDAVRSTRLLGALAVGTICASALALAIWPSFPVVMASRMLHAAASCVLGPVLAAISLGLVGHAALGTRLGRNVRFASVGNGITAAAMGVCGYVASHQAVFFLTAALAVPALLALSRIRVNHRGASPDTDVPDASLRVHNVLRDRRLLTFAACVFLFQLANAAMLPLMAGILTTRASESVSTVIAACIVLPQLIVAGFAPSIGRLADNWGRQPLLILCFAALAVRGVLFAVVTNPYLVVTVQVLDGISAGVLGITLPLVVADITRGTGHFNLGLGIVGSAVGIGAALSTTLAGYTIDRFGSGIAFCGLASVAALGLSMVWRLLPETRPRERAAFGHGASNEVQLISQRPPGENPASQPMSVRIRALPTLPSASFRRP